MRPFLMPFLAWVLLAASPGAAQPYTRFDLLWVTPATEAGAPRACSRLLVLNLPQQWMSRDAAVVVLADEGAGAAAFEALTRALLPQEAALLEYPSGPADGCPGDAPDQVGEVLGALRDLKLVAGAGLVVAIGLGAAGDAVLAAAREEVALRYLGPGGPRLAAAVALAEGGRARFAAGPALPAEEAWARRAPLLCAALAGMAARAWLADCLRALDPARQEPSLATRGRD